MGKVEECLNKLGKIKRPAWGEEDKEIIKKLREDYEKIRNYYLEDLKRLKGECNKNDKEVWGNFLNVLQLECKNLGLGKMNDEDLSDADVKLIKEVLEGTDTSADDFRESIERLKDLKGNKGALISFILFLKSKKYGLLLGGNILRKFCDMEKALVGSNTNMDDLKEIYEEVIGLIDNNKIFEDAIEFLYYLRKNSDGDEKEGNSQMKEKKNNGKEIKSNGNILEDYFKKQGYFFKSHQISSFYTALKTKGFVILAGLSGTGKTKMAQEFGNLMVKHLFETKYFFAGDIGKNNKNNNEPSENDKNKNNEVNSGIFIWDSTGTYPKDKKWIIERCETYPTYLFYFGKYGKENRLRYIFSVTKGWLLEKDGKKSKSEKIEEILNEMKNEENASFCMEGKYFKILGDSGGASVVADKVEEETFKKQLEGANKVFIIDKVYPIKKGLSKDELFNWDFSAGGQHLQLIPLSYIKDTYKNIEIDEVRQFIGDIVSQQQRKLQNKFEELVCFLSVRPDWKDSKQLLGFYNPLTHSYEPTPLFNFILNAIENYKKCKENSLPYFLILDEMNLAHVEYYFSDFLSVLESGRNENGYTREGIKVKVGEENDKNKEIYKKLKALEIELYDNGYINLHLPPNFYIIGTVNIDETTSMFSPKVLDRAFTIEFTDVDIDEYKKTLKGNSESSGCNIEDEDIEGLGKDFTNDGEFLKYGNKENIKKVYGDLKNKDIIDRLKNLNALLKPFNLHFGYRVVDEIMLFFDAAKKAEGHNIVKFENGDNEILDLAVMMKVLPKFHGNVAKLKEPLLRVLCWAKDGEQKGCEEVKNFVNALKFNIDSKEKLLELYNNLRGEDDTENKTDKEDGEAENKPYEGEEDGENKTNKEEGEVENETNEGEGGTNKTDKQYRFKYPHTAKKVLSMLYNLFTEGYTGFMQ